MTCIASVRDHADSESAWRALVRSTTKLLERDADRRPWALVAFVRKRGALGRRWRELVVVRAPTAAELRLGLAYEGNQEPLVDVWLVGTAPGIAPEDVLRPD